MRRTSLALALLATVLLPPSPSHAAGAIQPGAILYTPEGQCTMNFVFEDKAGKRYIGTAGHCVRAIGDRVGTTGIESFGSVVFRELRNGDDFSLIAIDSAYYPDVDPALRRWGGPTGVADDANSYFGDRVLQHGYGIVYGTTSVTRPRVGTLWYQSEEDWGAQGGALFGDSGGPLVRASDGTAIGFVNYIGVPYSMSGSTTEWFLVRLAAAGIHVSLVTAPYTPLVP